jgi:hypothetical protein
VELLSLFWASHSLDRLGEFGRVAHGHTLKFLEANWKRRARLEAMVHDGLSRLRQVLSTEMPMAGQDFKGS